MVTMWQGLYVQCYRGFLALVERGWMPDYVIRFGIRYLLRTRLTLEVGCRDIVILSEGMCAETGIDC